VRQRTADGEEGSDDVSSEGHGDWINDEAGFDLKG
jgi:hypothetical protein